ncbi:MAG: hypothetical protein ACM3PZ_02000 [Bacillota bacterium]
MATYRPVPPVTNPAPTVRPTNPAQTGQPAPQPQANPAPAPAPTPAPAPLTLKGIGVNILCAALGVVVFIIIRVIMPDGISWWAVNIIALGISMLFLAGAAALGNKNEKLAVATPLFILTVFFLFMVFDYNSHRGEVTDAQPKIVVLSAGAHSFELKPGEKTPWLRFEPNSIVRYNISSHSSEYDVCYSDGKIFPGTSETIPDQRNPSFYVQSKSDAFQLVTIIVRNDI